MDSTVCSHNNHPKKRIKMTFVTSTSYSRSFLILLTTCSFSPYHPIPGPPGRDGRDGKDGSPGVFSYENYIKLKEMIIHDAILERLVQIIKQEVVSAVDSLKKLLKIRRLQRPLHAVSKGIVTPTVIRTAHSGWNGGRYCTTMSL